MFPFPALLCDIGGTNARFWLLPSRTAPASPMVRLNTSEHDNFAAAFETALARGGFPRPRSLLVGAAGPVRNRTAVLTNAAWHIDGPALADALDLDQGILFNDFETLALALPALSSSELFPIGDVAAKEGLRLIVGPGTGLGVGALALVGGRFLPLSSEGGHIGFAPESEEERRIWDRLDLPGSRIQAEMLLAGPGLSRLYSALDAAPVQAISGREISERALHGLETRAQRAIQLWIRLLARFSGDMALTFMASGGVYLAGGILPQIRQLIDARAFRRQFRHNEAHGQYLRAVPVHLICSAEPAMSGLAALARAPELYLVDYQDRLWR